MSDHRHHHHHQAHHHRRLRRRRCSRRQHSNDGVVTDVTAPYVTSPQSRDAGSRSH